MNNIKIFCMAVGQSPNGVDVLRVSYAYTPPMPFNGSFVESGEIEVDIAGLTDTEICIKNQNSILAHCQNEADSGDHGIVFTLADIRGGRI